MKGRTLTIIIVIALIAVGAMVYPKLGSWLRASDVEKSTASVVLDRGSHDFGDVALYGGTVSTTFTLTNTGADDVLIISGTSSCGCTSAELEGVRFGMHERMSRHVTIPAGKTRELTVIYDPLAHGPSGVGLAERSVILTTNSSVTPKITVDIEARVINSE